MILSNIVIDDLKDKSGLLFDQAKDFDMLAKLILDVTQIGRASCRERVSPYV